MNKRIVTLVLVVAMFLLSGCQLAVPNAEESAYSNQLDKMVGIFVTAEELNLFDFDAFPGDNIDENISTNDDGQHDIRSYTELVEDKFTDPDGNERSKFKYNFFDADGSEIKGMELSYIRKQPDESGSDDILNAVCDDNLYDITSSRSLEGNDESIEQSAYIYVPYSTGKIDFYINSIYQTADGKAYLSSDNAEILQCDDTINLYSRSLSGTHILAINGDEQISTYKGNITVKRVSVSDRVVLIQMDEDHKELRRDEYVPGQMPEKIIPEKNAAYILIEEHYEDTINRSINQPEDGAIEVFYCCEDNICTKDSTEVIW